MTIPKEIKNENELLKLAKDASVCKVIRVGEKVKLKLRCPRYLYTYVTDPESSEALLKKIPCKIIEL
ncbi:MAG: hypothetical protein ACTSRP_06485 [Candidatus Helarchaeota archaeon]